MTIEKPFSYEIQPPRMNYFTGQFLEEKDFKAEQDYHLARRRNLNKELFSRGVRRGFEVTVHDGKTLRIDVGNAIDGHGRELWLEQVLELNNFLVDSQPPADGEYHLCMHLEEVPGAEETYSLPAGAEKQNDSTWKGYTRNIETIGFRLVPSASPEGQDEIRLGRWQYAAGVFSEIRPEHRKATDRHLSTTSLGAGLTANRSGHHLDMYHNGELNAFIGADLGRQGAGAVTFSSKSQRMHLTGEADFYVLHKQGMVISKAWYGAEPKSGSLIVEGETTLKNKATMGNGLSITGGDLEIGPEGSSVVIKGGKLASQKITAAGLALSFRENDQNSGPLLFSSNRFHISGERELLIGNRQGVVISKSDYKDDKEGRSGDLQVRGNTSLDGTLLVHGLATFGAGLKAGRPATFSAELKIGPEKEADSPDLQLTISHHPNADKSLAGPKLFSGGRMHISGDAELYLLNKKGVVIAKNWYNASSESGSLEVQGKAIFRDLVVYSSKAWRRYANDSDADSWKTVSDEIKSKLKNDGDFTFFADTNDQRHLHFYWRSAGEIRGYNIGHNKELNPE